MLSKKGFEKHLDDVEHYTNLKHIHNEFGLAYTVKTSKDVLLRNFELQQAKIEKYERALKFYADKENYEVTENDLDPTVSYVHIIDTDEGDTARKALRTT